MLTVIALSTRNVVKHDYSISDSEIVYAFANCCDFS
jgi:hypothetical protein